MPSALLIIAAGVAGFTGQPLIMLLCLIAAVIVQESTS